jgi:hypothetical protein
MQSDSSNENSPLETLMLLENYIEDSAETRKWLLELMFQTLDKIDNQQEDPTLNRFELSKRRGIVQIDIIAKLMIYIRFNHNIRSK